MKSPRKESEDTKEEPGAVARQLRKAREATGLSRRKVADRLGVGPTTYRHYESPELFKGAYLPLELAEKLVEVVPEYPDFGAKAMALAGKGGGEVSPEGHRLIPVHNVSASAGSGSVAGNETPEYSLAFPANYLRRLAPSNPKELALITVRGDSMYPTLVDGDMVLLDRSNTNLGQDGLFVLRFGDTLHVKRVSRSAKPSCVKVISDNHDLYHTIDMELSDIAVIGKVLWYGRKV